jgi:hypothetical protein
LLNFANGIPFAIGALMYQYAPATPYETTNRIILPIAIDLGRQVTVQAVLDTGSPYGIIMPEIAVAAGFGPDMVLEKTTLNVRGFRLNGSLTRLNLTLRAQVGDSLTVDATVFVPDGDQLWGAFSETWGDFPAFVGLAGFLERIRFAIDPTVDMLYFGPP